MSIFETLLQRQEKQLGRSQPTYLNSQIARSMAPTATGQTDRAMEVLRAAMKGYSELYGEDSDEVKAVQSMLSNLEPTVAPD